MNRIRHIFAALLLILVLCFSSKADTQLTIKLNDAIKNRMVLVEAVYNKGSVHYLKPVQLKLTLQGNKPLRIILEAGDIMEPEDSSCQTMMIVNGMFANLFIGKPVSIEPDAMCIEPHDRAGYKDLNYKFNVNKNQQLIDIAQFIDANNYDASVAQQAVWCVAEKSRSLLEINGYDSLNREKLIKKVAAITGKKMPTLAEIAQGHQTYVSPPEKEETIGGMFEFNFAKVKKVHIAMFDSNGIVVRELYYNANEKPGLHTVNFEFDYTIYTDAYYDIKLIADEKVCLTSRVDRKDENWIED